MNGLSEVVGYIPSIKRETEKAYLLDYKHTTGVAEMGYNRYAGSATYEPVYADVWVAKSQVQIKGNKVVAISNWLAEKVGLVTKGTQAMKTARSDAYNALVAQAKSLGIKGAKAGWKTATLKKAIEKKLKG